MVVRSRLVVVKLFEKLKLATGGTAYASAPVYLDIQNEQFSELLPYCEQVTLIVLTEFAPTNFLWDVVFQSGYTRQSEVTSGAPFSLSTGVGQNAGAGVASVISKRHAPYTTIANFLLQSRLQLKYGNDTGSSADLAGTVSATLLMQTFGI